MNHQTTFKEIASQVQLFQSIEQKETFIFVLGALTSRLISLHKAAEIMEMDTDIFLKILELMGIDFSYLTISNGQKMAEALRKISKKNIFVEIDPQKWQQEIRQDRSLVMFWKSDLIPPTSQTDLTPQPPSLKGKGEQDLLPSPFRRGAGGEVKIAFW
ncbi:hypothetical protein [Anabaena sp. FACHB-1237]|uniref:hypothetical protein n=1 Tax=Anabaena sp. FACHB-1237 TaxID=2692769 RepID=UPI001F54AC43|nr:hypothetical protein [Anabaena sp. FACHB-1237]